jgi:hypothetical protein
MRGSFRPSCGLPRLINHSQYSEQDEQRYRRGKVEYPQTWDHPPQWSQDRLGYLIDDCDQRIELATAHRDPGKKDSSEYRKDEYPDQQLYKKEKGVFHYPPSSRDFS